MTVSRLPLINPSLRTNHLTRSLSTLSRKYCSARPKFSGTDVGARHRHGTNRPAHMVRDFHSSSTSKAAKEELPDHYKIMRLTQNATPEQIKHSYFKLSKELHPDSVNRKENSSEEEYKQMQKSYNVLSKPDSRREYDLEYNFSKATPPVSSKWGRRSSPAEPDAEKPFNPKEWFESFHRRQGETGAGGEKHRSAPHQPSPEEPYQPPPPHELSRRAKLRRERQTAGEAGAGAHGAHQSPLEMGFRPRSSWDPRFAKFFDDWSKKMKEQGWDPTQTTSGPKPGSPAAAGNKAAEMMDANLLSEWIKYARKEGKDPMGSLFGSSAGRGSATGVWLKNRMAALDREEAKKAGGAWERGGARRGDNISRNFNSSWGKGPAGSKRPVYSTDGPSGTEGATQTSGRKGTRGMAYAWNAAEGMEHLGEWDAALNLGGSGTGEETFNAPWDSVSGRGFKNDIPRPWWAAGAPPEGKDPHTHDTWSPDPKFANAWGKRPRRHPSMLESTFSAPPPNSMDGSIPTGTKPPVYSGPVKRDYSKGHQLDERYEEDKQRIAANEHRMLSMVAFAVALGAMIAAGRAAGV